MSRFGLVLTLAFIGLIAFAFAASDVSGTGTFGGISGSDSVAVVGDSAITTVQFNRRVQSTLSQMRQQNPTLSMRAFVEQDNLDDLLEQMVDRLSIAEFARESGLRAGDNLVNSKIMQIPQFQGPDGNFNQQTYEAMLAAENISDATLRADLQQGLLAEQSVLSATFGTPVPQKFAAHYTALLGERRTGSLAFIPSAAFVPENDPSDAEAQAFYTANRARYIRPERRIIRFVTFGMDNVDARTQPSDAEIAARYESNKAQYAASEERTFTRLIIDTEQAAEAIRNRVEAGASLEAVAREAEFSTTKIGPITQQAYAQQSKAEIAEAAFAGSEGAIAAVREGDLGWHVTRIDKITRTPARSLADVRDDIRTQLTGEMQIAALADLASRIEEEVDGGTSLSEVAKQLETEVTTTSPLTADGRVYENPRQSAPVELARVLSTAFQLEEGEPQLDAIEAGASYIVYETSEITESAPAPLADIRERLNIQWKLDVGAQKASAVSQRILKQMARKTSLSEALASEQERLKKDNPGRSNAQLPPLETVDLSRREVVAQNRRLPPPLALLFSMAQGTVKRLEGANDLGWFVVELDDITTQPLDDEAQSGLIAKTQNDLKATFEQEYQQQLVDAMRANVGAERNDDALEALRRQLIGES